ncbi:hypothetical protein HDU87_003221 [Geranomyces variabilis]|uniref:Glutathione S-transferase n=1 Tax=Geranomyces variabilis TaxID=109894 RepID=A0AAD5XRI6_9FUNG|nr:hypothetical protein HDU87_003221 [Geranomyces variabilis]
MSTSANPLGGTPDISYWNEDHFALGESYRLFFVDAGIPFTNTVVKWADWTATVKASLVASGRNPAGTLPVVSIGDTHYFQLAPTLRLFAKKLGQHVNNDAAEYVIDQVADLCADLRGQSFVYHVKDQEAIDKFTSVKLPAFAKAFDVLLGRASPAGPFFGGAEPCYVDFIVYQTMMDEDVKGVMLEGLERLKKYKTALEARPKIKAYLGDEVIAKRQ